MIELNSLTSYALIDLDALANNIQTIKSHIGPHVELMAVLKANAYGHGAVPVAQTVLASGATRLVVARHEEGIQLRKGGISVPILVNGYSLPGTAEQFVAYDLIATVNTIQMARALSESAGFLGKTTIIHVKVDSGMGRYGLLPAEVLPFLAQVAQLPNLCVEGIFTHFASADDRDKSYTQRQFSVFEQVLIDIKKAGYEIPLCHASNSAATIDLPGMNLNAVRCGIAIYGLRPSPDVSEDIPLQSVLSLHSHVARVRELPANSAIGYGCTYVTSKPTRIALIPIGYADGYHRAFSNRGYVLIRGQRAPIVGRISMDQLTVDVTGIDGADQDDEVVLIGRQNDGLITADDLASLIDTISYELMTSLASRIPRIYKKEGQIVGIVCPLCGE